MTFFVLLTKEMRLRMRQERTVWVLIVYVLLLGSLGWLYLSRSMGDSSSVGYDWNSTGTKLYQLLTLVQMVLIIFISPSFTSGAINTEKELRTYDMLLCSQISAFSLVAGKLIAGLSNVLLLIGAAIPLFSLVFFFGSFTPLRILQDLAVFAITAAMVASFGLLCSILFAKRSTSTAIAYVVVLLWLIAPFLYLNLVPAPIVRDQVNQQYNLNLLVWNPLVILSLNGGVLPYVSATYVFAGMHISSWLAYILLSLGATLLFFLLSLCFVRPHTLIRIRASFIAYRKNRKRG